MTEEVTNSGYKPRYKMDYLLKDRIPCIKLAKIVEDSKENQSRKRFVNLSKFARVSKEDMENLRRSIFSVNQKAAQLHEAIQDQHSYEFIEEAMIYEAEHQINSGKKTQSTQAARESFKSFINALKYTEMIYVRITKQTVSLKQNNEIKSKLNLLEIDVAERNFQAKKIEEVRLLVQEAEARLENISSEDREKFKEEIKTLKAWLAEIEKIQLWIKDAKKMLKKGQHLSKETREELEETVKTMKAKLAKKCRE